MVAVVTRGARLLSGFEWENFSVLDRWWSRFTWDGRTWRFSLLSTYIASQKFSGHSAPVRMEWHERSLQEKYLEESVREVRNGQSAKELQSTEGLEKLSVITGARWGHSIVWSVYKVDNPGPVSRKAQKLFVPKTNLRIKTCWIVAQFLAHKPVNFAPVVNW